MPVQMIELEEVQMVNVSDEALETVGGIYIGYLVTITPTGGYCC